jgi:hypothetical protein
MGVSGGFSVRSILRAILAIALLLGSGGGDWTALEAQSGQAAHESCCCGSHEAAPDPCGCPQPEGNRTPSSTHCTVRTVVAAEVAVRRTQVQRRTEPRPEPLSWARTEAAREDSFASTPRRGRDPDLGRHLARLGTFLI